MLIPMREELTRAGIEEARTAEAVDAAVASPGTTMVVVNSVCGCAAGKMRPGVRLALRNPSLPDRSDHRFCRSGQGSDRQGALLLRGQSAHFAGDRRSCAMASSFTSCSGSSSKTAHRRRSREMTRAFDELCAKQPLAVSAKRAS